MQSMTDGLRCFDELQVLVANVQMAPGVLMDRQLSRLSGIGLNIIQNRKFTADHIQQLHNGFLQLEAIVRRLGFVRGPFTFDNLAHAADKLDHKFSVWTISSGFKVPLQWMTDGVGSINP